MQNDARPSTRRTLGTLHPVFALTGVIHAIGGALLPSLARTFHLTDSQSGLLFFLYFAGSSIGALLCRRSYARTMAIGFVAAAVLCTAVASAPWPSLLLVFFLLGVSVGVPMSAVSLFVGRNFAEHCAPLLTFLNFSWSAGALLAPLFAGWLLLHHSYRAAYMLLAVAALVAALACLLSLRDAPEPPPIKERNKHAGLPFIAAFAVAAFLQVGVENTAAAWLPTYALRTAATTVAFAATISSLYWIGFLAARGVAALVLLRVQPTYVVRIAIVLALAAALLLVLAPAHPVRGFAMFLLGIGLAPVYPLVVAGSLARVQHTSHSRWVLASAGFGGSVLPWLAGTISAHTGSLPAGIFAIPAALLLMLFFLPAFSAAQHGAANAHNAETPTR